MLTTLLIALVIGCIVGPLARLILPGRQNISTLMTVILGAVGSLVGAYVGAEFLGRSGGQWSPSGIILGTVFAIVAVVIYIMVTGKNKRVN